MTTVRSIARTFLKRASIACFILGGYLAFTTEWVLWEYGRLTSLGAVTVVPALIVVAFGVLWLVAPRWEARFGERSSVGSRS